MLTTKEERIVSQLYLELFNRQRFGNRMGPYINGPHPGIKKIIMGDAIIVLLFTGENQRVNCSINTLAKLNVQSCTAVVRAAATFFLKMDTFQEYCNHKG